MNDYMKRRMENILSGRPLPKKEKKGIAKKSAKRIEKEKKESEERGDNDTELQKWYRYQVKKMSVCEETGMKLETNIYRYAIMSVCHILPKSTCKSVKTHPANKLYLLPDLHFKWDNSSWEEREKWSCWPVVEERLIHIYDSLDPLERRHFPESVEKYIKDNESF